MAIEKTIIIHVEDKDVQVSEKRLESLGHSIEKVEDKSKKAGASTKDTFEGAGESASNLQGGIEGIGQEFGNVASAAKKGGAAMRSALISTGIGAVVVALGLIIDNWSKIKDLIDDTNVRLKQRQLLLERNIELVNDEVDILDKEAELLKLQGKSTEEITKKKEEQLLIQQTLNESLLNNLQIQLEREKAQIKEITLWEKIKIGALNAVGAYGQASIESAKAVLGNEEQLERLDELQNAINDSKENAIDLEIALLKLRNPGIGKEQKKDKAESVGDVGDTDINLPLEQLKRLEEQRTEILRKGTETFREEQQERINVELDALKQQADIAVRRNEIERQAAEERKAIAEAEAKHKQDQNDVIFSSADSLGQALFMLGQESKAAAVTGIIIDQVAAGAQAIQSLVVANAKAAAAFPLTAGQPFVGINTASTIAGIAAGALAAKKAISEIGGGGSTASFSAPQAVGGVTAPAFNIIGANPTSQLAQTLQSQDNPIKAFVVGSDVTSQQQLDRNIITTATIG